MRGAGGGPLTGLLALLLTALLMTACTGGLPKPPTRSATDVAATIARGLADQVALGPTIGADYSGLRAVIVRVDGQTVFEEYYSASPEDAFDVGSVTAGVLSTLVGIAVRERKLQLDDPLATLLPDHAASMPRRTARATLRQLLSMTAGLSPRVRGLDPEFSHAPDWVLDIVTAAGSTAPGTSFLYADEGAHLVTAILEEATGEPLLRYARTRLFAPLGIPTEPAYTPSASATHHADYREAAFAWPVDPQGRATGHCCLKLRPEDLAKLGQLYLDHGMWEDRRVLPVDWARSATVNQSTAPVNDPLGLGYGFLWWVRAADEDPAYAALGTGGQMIEVVPNLGLVVVTAVEVDATDATDQGVNLMLTTSLVESVIAPAVRGGA